jgi:two-component system NtrC family sensor kinase
MTAQQDRVDINELISEALSFVEREAENNSIAIIKNFSPDLPATMTDGPQLQQVFLNLINNALDAVGPKGVVEISTRLSGNGRLVVECADNGRGIKPEDLEQIFDPFFTTKDPDKGTGLGLYISYDIIKKLGGTISAENRKGGGALFKVILPVKSYGKQE